MADKKYHYKITEDGAEVLDQNDKVVVRCPTEQEAVEYIREQGEAGTSPFLVEWREKE